MLSRTKLLIALSFLLAMPAAVTAGDPVEVVAYSVVDGGALVRLDVEPGLSGTIAITVCAQLADGTTQSLSRGIDSQTNSHDSGRRHAGSGSDAPMPVEIEVEVEEPAEAEITSICGVTAEWVKTP